MLSIRLEDGVLVHDMSLVHNRVLLQMFGGFDVQLLRVTKTYMPSFKRPRASEHAGKQA